MLWLNLYTELIEINNKFIFESYYNDVVDWGKVLVNGEKPNDINMKLNHGDVLKVFDEEYVI